MSNFESVENVQSLNVVEFEFELRHISNIRLLFSCFVLLLYYR